MKKQAAQSRGGKIGTPRPWTYDETWALVKGPKGEEICAIHSGQGDDSRVNRNVAYENAEHIVTACNCHDDLLAALQHALSYMEADADDEQEREDYAEARAAIARAQGQSAKDQFITDLVKNTQELNEQ